MTADGAGRAGLAHIYQRGPKGCECIVCAYSSTNPALLETEDWWRFTGKVILPGRVVGLLTCLRLRSLQWTCNWCGMFAHRAEVADPWPELPPSIHPLDRWRDDGTLYQAPPPHFPSIEERNV